MENKLCHNYSRNIQTHMLLSEQHNFIIGTKYIGCVCNEIFELEICFSQLILVFPNAKMMHLLKALQYCLLPTVWNTICFGSVFCCSGQYVVLRFLPCIIHCFTVSHSLLSLQSSLLTAVQRQQRSRAGTRSPLVSEPSTTW